MTYLYRSILTPIQIDDLLLLAVRIGKQIAVVHSAMLPVPTLSPLAQEKAALLGCSRRVRAHERPVPTKPDLRFFAAYHGRFQRYRYRFVAGACLGRVGEERPVVRLAGADA